MQEIGQKPLPAGSKLSLAERVRSRYSLVRDDWVPIESICDPKSVTFVANYRLMRFEQKVDMSDQSNRDRLEAIRPW
jgi:hypothetical protein